MKVKTKTYSNIFDWIISNLEAIGRIRHEIEINQIRSVVHQASLNHVEHEVFDIATKGIIKCHLTKVASGP